MSTSSGTRRFIKHPARSTLEYTVEVKPAGAVGVLAGLYVDGIRIEELNAGGDTVQCTNTNTSYRVDIDQAWLKKAEVTIKCSLTHPKPPASDGAKVEREPMVFVGKSKDGAKAQILVVTK